MKKSEQEFKELSLKLKQRISISEEKYKAIFENTGTAILICEEDTTISLVNGQFEELSGYSREEIEWKKSWTEFVIEEDLERMKKLDFSKRKDPESTQKKYEFRFVTKEGNIRDILISIDMIPGTKKSVGSLLDITERKKTEETIKKEVEKSKNYLNIAGVVIVALDTAGNITLLNKKGHELLGYDEGELIGKNWFEVCLPPRERERVHEYFKKLITGEIELINFYENPIWTKTREEKLISWSTVLFKDENGNATGVLSSGEDITERKKAERELQLERDNFLNILNSMEDGVYIVDSNYDIEYVNPILIKEFGNFEGIKCFNYFHDFKEICPWCKNEDVSQGKTIRWESYLSKNQKIYEIIGTPLKNPDGSISKLEIFRDITEKKKVEKDLKESEEKYRDAYNRAEFYKDIFTHDINNILQSILSGTQIGQLLLNDHEKFDDLKLNAEIIKEQVIRGSKLIKNVRKLSKLEEAGQSLEKIEILSVLKNTVSFIERSYMDKNLTIQVDSIEEKLFTKANNFLEDVFENLLINAIRHNKNSMIEITIRISREQDLGMKYHKMEFFDNGIGVDDSMKNKIFQRGYNEGKGVPGLGLGLSLVRRIIETYSGKIMVEDRVMGDRLKGSNFVLLIPEVD